MLKKSLKILAGIASFTLLFLLLIWCVPSILIHTSTLKVIQKIAAKQGVVLEWKESSLSAQSLEWNRKEIDLSLDDLCIQGSSLVVEGCFSKVRLSLQFGVKNFKPVLLQLGPATILSDHFVYQSDSSAQSKETDSTMELPEFALPEFLKELNIKLVDIQLNKLQIRSKDTVHEGSATLKADEVDGNLSYKVNLKFNTLTFLAELKSPKTPKEREWSTTAEVHYQNKNESLVSIINIRGASDSIKGTLSMKEIGLTGPFEKIEFKDCPLSLTKKTFEELKLSCSFDTTVRMPASVDFPYNTLLKNVKINLGLVAERKDQHSPTQITIALNADPLFAPLKTGQGTVKIHLAGDLKNFPTNWKYAFDSKIDLNHFARLTRFFEKTSWPVPEPFNTMDGNIILTVKGSGDFASNEAHIPFNIETNLTSKKQTLRVLAQNELVIQQNATKVDLTTDLILKEVTLVLPPLNIAVPPRFLPDERIKTEETEKTKKSAQVAKEKSKTEFHFNFKVRTDEGPVYLVSKTSTLKVPLKVNIKSKGEKTTGEVIFHPFKAELFKRTAQVESAEIKLHDNPDNNEINSRINLIYTDYTITVLLSGLLKQPHVELMSNPPLPQKQLIAVLLFGRSLDQLDPDQASSVGNTEAAITEGIIGLSSLYALASTPIESVGYDPNTRIFSAKIRLQDGTSMNIGGDTTAVRRLGIRKRMSPNWFINTYFENPFLSAERSVTGLFEWNWRY